MTIKKHHVILAITILLLTTSLLSSSIHSLYINYERSVEYRDAMDLWLKTYRLVKAIAEEGGDTSKYLEKLNETYTLIARGESDRAIHELEKLYSDALKYYHELDASYKLMIASKIIILLLILSTPIIFYIVFPRIYLEVWFRTRKNWVVEE